MKKRANSQGGQNECRAERHDKRELRGKFFPRLTKRKLPGIRLNFRKCLLPTHCARSKNSLIQTLFRFISCRRIPEIDETTLVASLPYDMLAFIWIVMKNKPLTLLTYFCRTYFDSAWRLLQFTDFARDKRAARFPHGTRRAADHTYAPLAGCLLIACTG